MPHTARIRSHLAVALVAAAVTALSELPRILVAAGALPDPLRPFTWSDLLATYYLRGLADGRRPYFDVPFEYPPLVGYPAGLIAIATNNAAAYVAAWAIIVVAASAMVGFFLSREAGPRRALFLWALAPQLLLYAGLNVDVVPAGLLVAAALLARRDRHALASITLALGSAAKLFPAASLPVLALRGRTIVVMAAFAVAFAIIMAPALLAQRSVSAGLTYYALGYEAGGVAVWGLVAAALRGIGVADAALVVLIVTTAGLLATYVLLVLPWSRRARDPAVGFALATIALLWWSRLYSPQFSLWILPFFTLLPALRRRTFVALATADIAVFMTASPLTLVRWDPNDLVAAGLIAVLAAAVVMRHAALVFAWADLTAGRVA